MKKHYRQIITCLVTVLLMGISNIACTKPTNNVTTMPADTTAVIAPDTPHTPVDTMPVPPADSLPATDTTQYQYLALGDSYTIGQSVPEDERFPAQAVALLKKEGINLARPQYIATTGWTTTNLQNAIATQNPQGPYKAVTLLIGVNDQYQHIPISEYPGNFTTLLEKAIALAGGNKQHVFVLSIPDYSVTPFGGGNTTIRDEIDAYNAINKNITLAHGVAYIDITGESRKAATDLTLIAGDGLHPSGKQYALWVSLLVPVMEKGLK